MVKAVTVWHPVREGFRVEVTEGDPGPDRRMTIVVHREVWHLNPAGNCGRGEWAEVGRLTVSAWDTDALLCFADTTTILLTMDGEPVEFGPDGHEAWGACAGQVISEGGELAIAVVSDDGNEITYSLTTDAA